MIDRQTLGSMTLQRLAYILPQNSEEETVVKEIFAQRASNSTYQTLTTIDVKLGWQETILQKYIDEKREGMAPENPASLSPEDEGRLDTAVVTKETELELQDKLDKKNKKQKGLSESEDEIEDPLEDKDEDGNVESTQETETIDEPEETMELEGEGTIDEEGNIQSEPVKVIKVTKKGRPKKK